MSFRQHQPKSFMAITSLIISQHTLYCSHNKVRRRDAVIETIDSRAVTHSVPEDKW